MSWFLCISRTTFVNPIKSSGFGLSPNFSATPTICPPTVLKKADAFDPIIAKHDSIPLASNSADFAITYLNKLILRPPHKPLSEDITIKQAFFGSLFS